MNQQARQQRIGSFGAGDHGSFHTWTACARAGEDQAGQRAAPRDLPEVTPDA